MKKSIIIVVCVSWMGVLGAHAVTQAGNATQSPPAATASQGSAPASGPELKNDKEKISYALGMRWAIDLKDLRARSVDFDPDLVVQGMLDSLAGRNTRLTDDQRFAILSKLQKDLEAAEKQKLAETNLKQGEEFLAANKTKEGVITLPSGLEYKVLTQGTGSKPTLSDTVICNYRGTFIDGKEFDSSYKRGQPSVFPVAAVIRGWTEALQLMPVGSKWQLFVPPGLAYGELGHRQDIQPNATLIFEVELLSIKPKEDAQTK